MGTLFGGVAITYDEIKQPFIPLYYLSVPAWGYRTMLVNDFGCCHLVVTCADLEADPTLTRNARQAEDLYRACHANYTLYPELEAVADNGLNLGAIGLKIMDISTAQDASNYNTLKYEGVVVLGIMAVLLRGLAAYFLRYRAKRENRLNIIEEEQTELRIRSIIVDGQPMDEMELSTSKPSGMSMSGPPTMGPKQGWAPSRQKVDTGVDNI